MSVFTASNEISVSRKESGGLVIDGFVQMNAKDEQAAREFFLAERDEGLGRWRWPESPEWLAVEGDRSPDGRTVVIVNERTLDRFWFNELVMVIPANASAAHKAGCAYFEAHPTPEPPKPWHDVKPGEVWVLTIDGVEEPAMLYRPGEFETPTNTYPTTARCITAGRLIWPEEDNS